MHVAGREADAVGPVVMDECEELEVARGLRTGDPDAWRRLYDAHARRVWGLVARAVGADSTEVGDVVQEVFLAAARSAAGFDPARGSLAAWLTGVSRRQIALHFRRRKRHLPVVDSGMSDRGSDSASLMDGGDGPAAEVAAGERADRLRTALTELPADYEVLLITKYLDGATIEQIAVSENSSTEAIRSKLARARRALRAVLRRDFPELCGDDVRVHDDV